MCVVGVARCVVLQAVCFKEPVTSAVVVTMASAQPFQSTNPESTHNHPHLSIYFSVNKICKNACGVRCT